jgi:hypothetical protein
VRKQQAVTDLHLVRALLGLHAVSNPRILDASYGRGGIWRGLPYKPTRLDARELADVDVVGNWNALASLFPPASFDVVVWDPPHVTDAGSGIVGADDWADRYGTLSPGLKGASIAPLFAPFLEAARAVLQPATGIVLAKIADQVHDERRQWTFVDLVLAARVAGFTSCDYAVKPHSSPTDPKWKNAFHLRSPTFWLVLRNGPSCHGPGVGRLRICVVDGIAFKAKRRDAMTCSDRCRQRRRRAAVQAN